MIIASSHSSRILRYWWIFAFGLALPGSSDADAAAADKRCHQRVKAKQNKAAAECFETLARSLGPANALDKKQKYAKGQWLRNAAILLRRAAKQTPKDTTKLRIHATQLLALYLREALCETTSRCLRVKSLRDAIVQEIGYALIAVVTGDPKATFVLRGVGLTRRGGGDRWEGKLPPGSYLLTATYPNGKSQVKAFQVKRLEAQVVQLSPPVDKPTARRNDVIIQRRPPARRPDHTPNVAMRRKPPQRTHTPPIRAKSRRPIWPWIVVGIGGAALVGGVVALAAGKGMEANAQGQIATLRQGSSQATAADSSRLLSQFDAADASIITGWSMLGVGVAAVTVGIVGAVLGAQARPSANVGDDRLPEDTGGIP